MLPMQIRPLACHFDLRQIILISALINGDVYIISVCNVLILYSTKFSQAFNFVNFVNFQPFAKIFQ